MTNTLRKDASERFDELLDVAVDIAEREHYLIVTARKIAERVPCSVTLVNHYLGDIASMRAHILQAAILRGNAVILEQYNRSMR